MRVISSTAIALVLASAAAVFCAPVHAETISVKVGYSDLDLSKASGVAALERRIGNAVRKICGSRPSELSYLEAWRTCATDAQQSAEPQMAYAVNMAGRETYAAASPR